MLYTKSQGHWPFGSRVQYFSFLKPQCGFHHKYLSSWWVIFKCIGTYFIWALTQENLSSGVCEQLRLRLACTFAQSDQHLCYLLFGKYHIKACYERNFNFVASPCSWAGLFESHFVGSPEDRFWWWGPYNRDIWCDIFWASMYTISSLFWSHKDVAKFEIDGCWES